MSNFLQNPNMLKMLAIAALGPLALTACGASTEAAEPPTTITCTSSKLHVVEKGETLTGIFREHVADGSLDSSDIHNTITVVANVWEDAGSRTENLPEELLVDGSKLPAFNQSKLPEPQAESTIAIPEICSKR